MFFGNNSRDDLFFQTGRVVLPSMTDGGRTRLPLFIALFTLAFCSASVGGTRASPASHTSSLETAIVVQNFYYALPGKADEVYLWRLHASEVRTRLGLAVGRVLRRAPALSGDGIGEADWPDVVWECEYPNLQARAAHLARLDASREFDAVEAHMKTLIREFRRGIFTVAKYE